MDLDHLRSHAFSTLPHSDRHVAQERRVPNVRGVAVAVDVGGPFELGGVGVTGTDVACLQLFKLLLSTQFIGL